MDGDHGARAKDTVLPSLVRMKDFSVECGRLADGTSMNELQKCGEPSGDAPVEDITLRNACTYKAMARVYWQSKCSELMPPDFNTLRRTKE